MTAIPPATASSSDAVFIIAEAGVNHNGSLDRALQLVEAAAEAGADAVKFQSFRADEMVSRDAPKAAYQIQTTGKASSQFEMLQQLELDAESHRRLRDRCRERGIEFMSTPFDLVSLRLLLELGVKRLKISSGEITNAPLLFHAARTGLPIILSTGMATMEEVGTALGALSFGFRNELPPARSSAFWEIIQEKTALESLRNKVTLLHCTTEYPAPFAEVNLRVMETLKQRFNLPCGLSDHTEGIAVPIAAAALGAPVIEKHMTLDRSLPGPDHSASLEPTEFKAMVKAIRQVEQSLGSPDKQPAPSERKNLPVVRKRLVAKRAIRAGEPFTEENLTAKRPGDGLSPVHYWEWLGKTADRSYQMDEPICPNENR